MFWVLLLSLFSPPVEMEEKPLNYFLENRTERCWVLDRASNKQVVSIAASGFGMAAWVIAAEKGKIEKMQAIEWVNRCLDETIKTNKGNHGWLYHFTNLEGKPVFQEEVSSIDSAIFYEGARWAAHRLGDKELIDKVKGLIDAVDQKFMMSRNGAIANSAYFSHGFHWQNGKEVFIDCDWGDEYTEGVILYRLFNRPYHPSQTPETLPLFVYYYPLCFYQDQSMIDLLGRAIDTQLKNHGVVGYTACDGPNGYGVMQPDVISPLAVASCEPFYHEKLKKFWTTVKVPKTTPALQVKSGWISEDRIGIDDGAYLMLHNQNRH